MTTITLQSRYGSISITIDRDDMNIMEVFEDLITPALLASGYSQETINDYLGV